MLKKIYKKDGNIIIQNDHYINELSFYYYLINNMNGEKDLKDHKKEYYKSLGFIY
jgi:hypothetical protein